MCLEPPTPLRLGLLDRQGRGGRELRPDRVDDTPSRAADALGDGHDRHEFSVVQLHLDGQKLGAPIDLYDKSVIPSGLLALGACDLTAGDHKLTVEILGANDKAVKSYMFALDYVKLTRE